VAKGGSWSSGRSRLRASWRAAFVPFTRKRSLGFRCASHSPTLRLPGPPLHLKKRPALPDPTAPLPPKLDKLFRQTPEDSLKKKLCPKAGRSGSHCKDPLHYVKSNEKRQHLFRPYIQNLGGAYVGIGADQNYNFIAWARSRLVWLMDYDMVIVWIHKIHRAFLLQAPSPQEFFRYWSPKHRRQSVALLKKIYANHPDRRLIIRAYIRYRGRLQRYFRSEIRSRHKKKRQHWLATPRHYRYIRLLYQLRRIRLMPGDLLKHKSLRGVAQAARKMKLTVRLVYMSNAEEYWYYPKHFRKTYGKIMPFDKKTLVLRTLSSARWGTKKFSYFHYNIQHGLFFKEILLDRAPGGYLGYRYQGIRQVMEQHRHHTRHGGLTTIKLPTTQRNPKKQ